MQKAVQQQPQHLVEWETGGAARSLFKPLTHSPADDDFRSQSELFGLEFTD